MLLFAAHVAIVPLHSIALINLWYIFLWAAILDVWHIYCETATATVAVVATSTTAATTAAPMVTMPSSVGSAKSKLAWFRSFCIYISCDVWWNAITFYMNLPRKFILTLLFSRYAPEKFTLDKFGFITSGGWWWKFLISYSLCSVICEWLAFRLVATRFLAKLNTKYIFKNHLIGRHNIKLWPNK